MELVIMEMPILVLFAAEAMFKSFCGYGAGVQRFEIVVWKSQQSKLQFEIVVLEIVVLEIGDELHDNYTITTRSVELEVAKPNRRSWIGRRIGKTEQRSCTGLAAAAGEFAVEVFVFAGWKVTAETVEGQVRSDEVSAIQPK